MTRQPDHSHQLISLDPAKCIACGLCVAWCEVHRLPVGLGFTGRGPRLAIAMPLGHHLAELPDDAARSCATLCPSGALSFKLPPSLPT
jgi:predicted molibdopterin-dependent oxidoreductase YjgC